MFLTIYGFQTWQADNKTLGQCPPKSRGYETHRDVKHFALKNWRARHDFVLQTNGISWRRPVSWIRRHAHRIVILFLFPGLSAFYNPPVRRIAVPKLAHKHHRQAPNAARGRTITYKANRGAARGMTLGLERLELELYRHGAFLGFSTLPTPVLTQVHHSTQPRRHLHPRTAYTKVPWKMIYVFFWHPSYAK
ncbi:hypothetical protein XA68_10602 [Ophiocordyceps unilateralis]|uniref:Uncharacterized protein n=1 Tax=Ophiocordyceps unilateralis TaxID=268505 RepID=A0A2A9PIA0_OPHUN|nr:hypothetical protein XA68_10602 [Ophiocordyceps unilateralis]